MATIRGGDKIEAALATIARDVTSPAVLRVGFLENAKYPDGTPVAMVAAIHNYGAPRAGIPPRPFFSNIIAQKSAEWGPAIGALLVANDYDVVRSFDIAGAAIVGQLKQSIIDTNDPPLSAATIKRKGFSKPLIDTSHMINSADHEVTT